jgi:hypothetical protein
MHLQKQDFLNTMRNHNLVQDIHDGFALSIFNLYENSARELFEENSPDRSGILSDSEKFIRLIIFGFGQTGEALALQMALTGHYLNGKKPQVVVIDRMAKEIVPGFLERYPSFIDFCDLQYLALEADSPQLIQHIVKFLGNPDALTTMVICFDDKTHNLLLGLQLENIKLNENETFATFSKTIKPYGLPSKVCSREAIFEGDLDKKARAIHAHYLTKRKSEPDFGAIATDVIWEDLSQEFKDSNRKAADHIGVKIRGIGCEIVVLDDRREETDFSDDELEKLSELEHRRWNAERSLAGWKYGKVKNEKIRQTPYLVLWNELPESIKDYDREAVKNIPAVLEMVGLKMVKRENI